MADVVVKFQTPAALLGIAQDLVVKGWQPVWCPQRNSGSFSPLPGCTGGVEFPTVLQQPFGAHKIAFRPPANVLVIDVDHYGEKLGMDTIDRAEEWLGTLPLTYRVTSRGYNNPSGRYMYRMPADLLVTDSSLNQFADEDTLRTDVEIVRTGHRFSWASGDFHYKNNELIRCYDEYGDECDMPAVDDLPELPQKWVDYLRNPPVAQKHEVYTRPSDGAEWWLSQADESLGSDAELASFAYNMLLSRVPEEDIFDQWMRVARADDPGWDWERKDFDRHLGARAQQKADLILAHQDEETEWFAKTGADLDKIAEQTRIEFENPKEVQSLRVEPPLPVDEAVSQQLQAQTERPPVTYREPTIAELAATLIKQNPKYDDLYYREAAKRVVQQEVGKLFAPDFKGFEGIGSVDDPAAPTLLKVMGKDSAYSAVVTEGTVTVLSAKRASGKTWVSSLWSAQVMRAGGHVMWLDFERQPAGLSQKLRSVGMNPDTVDNQLHYTSALPAVDWLVSAIDVYRQNEKPVLLVVDAFRTLQGLVVPGSNANDGDAVEQVYIEYLTPAVNAGATVVLLDHTAKQGDGSTFGSERKESAADYVIRLEKVESFTKAKPGYASLVCGKDRYGVIAEGDPVGYLWVPGDKSKSGRSIEQYPFEPELRNWSPGTLDAEREVEVSIKARRESFLLKAVADHPLHYTQSSLADLAKIEEPDLFDVGAASIRTNIINKLKTAGRLEQDANKKLSIIAEEPHTKDDDLLERMNTAPE